MRYLTIKSSVTGRIKSIRVANSPKSFIKMTKSFATSEETGRCHATKPGEGSTLDCNQLPPEIFLPVVFLKFLSILVLLGLPSRSAGRDNCPRPKKSSLRSSLFLFFTLDCNPIGSLFAKEGERNTHVSGRKPEGGGLGWGGWKKVGSNHGMRLI